MGCLLVLLTGFFPRLGLLIVWIFTNEVDRAYDSFWVPLVGLIFLPLTTVIYVLVAPGGLTGFEWLLIIVAFLIDLGAYGGGIFGRRR